MVSHQSAPPQTVPAASAGEAGRRSASAAHTCRVSVPPKRPASQGYVSSYKNSTFVYLVTKVLNIPQTAKPISWQVQKIPKSGHHRIPESRQPFAMVCQLF